MIFFEQALARLKYHLHTSEDQKAAAALGLSKAAFSERKKRNSFPEKELRALAQQRPDLGLDVDYILTGRHGDMPPRAPACSATPAMLADADAAIGVLNARENVAFAQWLDKGLVRFLQSPKEQPGVAA